MPRDFYDTLGVPRSATPDQLKKAYRKLAQKFHPDRNPGDKQAESQFKDVNEAYETLSDAKKRSAYDQFGHAGPGGGGGFPEWGPQGPAGKFDPANAEELFRRFFGDKDVDLGGMFGGGPPPRGKAGRRQPPPPPPPEDVETDVAVPFLVAAAGGTVSLQVGGRRIDVKIPAGIDDGKKLRVPASATGSTDLLIRVRIEPHPYFRRDGTDVLLDVPLGVAEAVLGAAVEVPTVGGERLTVKVPAGTSSGGRLRLRGKGMAGGDQYLVFQIVVPKTLDDTARQLIEAFAKQINEAPRAGGPWS